MEVFDRIKTIIERVPTGIDRLDDLLSGGFPQNSITLVSGTPGSGKTIMCYHYIQKGVMGNEKCLYLTSDERINNIIKQASELGFNFKEHVERGLLKFLYLDIEKTNVYQEIEHEIRNKNYDRVVLDSITPISEIPLWACDGINELIPSDGIKHTTRIPLDSDTATRIHIKKIMGILNKTSCTALVTSEIEEGSRKLSRDSISEFLVDGIILMDLDMAMDRRKLMIRKMRATDHSLKPQNITIKEGGIQFI